MKEVVNVRVVTFGELLGDLGYDIEGKKIVIDPQYQRDYVYKENDVKRVLGPMFRDRYMGVITIMPFYTNNKKIDTITNGRQRTETMYRIVTNRMPIPLPIAKQYLGWTGKTKPYFRDLSPEAQQEILSMRLIIEERRPENEDNLNTEEKVAWNEHVRQVFVEMNKNLKRMTKVETILSKYPNYGNFIKALEKTVAELNPIDWTPLRTVFYIDVVAFGFDLEERVPRLGGVPNPSWDGIKDIKLSSTQFLEKFIKKREEFYMNHPDLAERHKEKLRRTVLGVIKKYKLLTNGDSIKKVINGEATGRPGSLPTTIYAALIPYKESYLQEAFELANKRDKVLSAIKDIYASTREVKIDKYHGQERTLLVRELFTSNAMNSTRLRTAMRIMIEEAFIPHLGDPINERREYMKNHRELSKMKTDKTQRIHTWPPASSPAENREYYLLEDYQHTHAVHGPRSLELMEKLKSLKRIVKLR